MALSTLAASTMCSISSTTTERMTIRAVVVRPRVQRVQRAQVRRDRGQLELDRGLEQLPQPS